MTRARLWRLVQHAFTAILMVAVAVYILALYEPAQRAALPPGLIVQAGIVMAICAVAIAIASGRARVATFAHAHTSTGTIVEVVELPAAGDYHPTFLFTIEADLPNGVTLHRELDMYVQWPEPLTWVGKPIRFRHSRLDDIDIGDVFVGSEEYEATMELGLP